MKKLLKIVGALVALLIIAALVIPMFISAEYLKSQLVAQVKTATGRELVIKGDASLKIFPNIAVKVEDVTLGNPAGFSSKFFAHVDKLETGAALKPLLNKELRITGIAVEGAVLNLEENAAGAKNSEFTNSKPATPEAAAEPKAAGEKPSPLKQLAIGDVTLKNSSVTIIKPGAKPMVISDINLTVRGADGSAPLKIEGSANYQKETVKLKVGLEKSKAFLAGKSSPIELSAALPAGNISFKGAAINKEKLSAEGALDASISDLPKLLGWATGKPAGAGLPHKVVLKTGFFMQNPQAFALKDATLSADALSATGSLAISLEGAVPNIKGALKMSELDLDALSKPASGEAKAAAGSSGAGGGGASDGWSSAPIDASGLRAANANVKLSIGKLKSGKVEVSNIAADLALNNGVMKLALGNASLYGGAAKGTVSLDGSGAGLGLGANVDLSKVQIEPLMVALSGASKLEGVANLSLDVNGRGASERALVSALGGKAAMRINDGAIKGINIASFLRRAQKGGLLLSESSSEKTDFTELSANMTIANGIVSNDDLAMKSPVLRLSGKGTVSLPQKTINYRLVPNLVATIEGQGGKDASGLAVPLMVSGPWSNISVTPDFAGLIQDSLKDPKALKQNIQGVKDILGDVNSGKDLKRVLLGGEKAAPATTTPPPAGSAPATSTPPAAAPTTEPVPAPLTKEQKIEQGIGGFLKALEKKE